MRAVQRSFREGKDVALGVTGTVSANSTFPSMQTALLAAQIIQLAKAQL